MPPVKLEESISERALICTVMKNEFKSEVLKYILTIDKLPLKCRSKIDIVQR